MSQRSDMHDPKISPSVEKWLTHPPYVRRKFGALLALVRGAAMPKISRQQAYAQRMRARRRCRVCGQKSGLKSCYCLKHLVFHREAARRRNGSIKRHENASSYQGHWKQYVREFEQKRGPAPEFPDAAGVIPDTLPLTDPFAAKRCARPEGP